MILASYPEPGKVKTALGKQIGKEQAAALYKAMLLDCVQNCQSKEHELALCFEPKSKQKEFLKLVKIKKSYPQAGGPLGDKLQDCFEHFFKEFANILVIRADFPSISASMLRKAYASLRSKDVVLGKAEDGSFYLVGLKEPHALFDDIEWQSNALLTQLIKNADRNHLSYALMPAILGINSQKELQQFRRKVMKDECPLTYSVLQKIKIK